MNLATVGCHRLDPSSALACGHWLRTQNTPRVRNKPVSTQEQTEKHSTTPRISPTTHLANHTSHHITHLTNHASHQPHISPHHSSHQPRISPHHTFHHTTHLTTPRISPTRDNTRTQHQHYQTKQESPAFLTSVCMRIKSSSQPQTKTVLA